MCTLLFFLVGCLFFKQCCCLLLSYLIYIIILFQNLPIDYDYLKKVWVSSSIIAAYSYNFLIYILLYYFKTYFSEHLNNSILKIGYRKMVNRDSVVNRDGKFESYISQRLSRYSLTYELEIFGCSINLLAGPKAPSLLINI